MEGGAIRAAGNEDAKSSLRLASYMGFIIGQWSPSFEKDGGFAGGVGFTPGRGLGMYQLSHPIGLFFQSQPVNWQGWGVLVMT